MGGVTSDNKNAVTAALDFETPALEAFLHRNFGASSHPLRLERVKGGQSNPTYFVEWGGESMVLRKKPAGETLKGAHAIDREFRVLSVLASTPVPSPRPLLYEDDSTLLGTPFYLMERVSGRVFPDYALQEAPKAERRALYLGLADALASLHSLDPSEVGLGDFGRSGNYFERQLSRWTGQWRRSSHPPIAELDVLIEWLERHLPTDDGSVVIAHGDFRFGNALFHPKEPSVVAILDWELATLGHPLADLGFAAMAWHTAPDEYGGILGLDKGSLGLPDQAEFVARYAAGRGVAVDLQPFHIAFALFRFAVIFVGIAERTKRGSAAGQNAGALGPLATQFAKRGLHVANRI